MGTRDRLLPLHRTLGYVTRWNVAVDVGAHAGRWSKPLAEKFGMVVAFEPVMANRVAWRKTMRDHHPNAVLLPAALGDREGSCRIEGPGNSKYFYAVPDEAGGVDMVRLDSCQLQHLDLLKVDCEGGDTAALAGAIETIKRFRPVVCVESIAGHEIRYGLEPGAPLRLLESLGAKMVERVHVDHIFVFPPEA